MSADRLEWIFDTPSTADLAARYDGWAATYDADHDAWGWRGPELTVAVLIEHGGLDLDSPSTRVLDAGCGTGAAGRVLRRLGFRGRLIGVDLSGAMLSRAADAGYDMLRRGSIRDLPERAGAYDAVISTGVFTHGHVGGEAFAELCRVTRGGGAIAITRRDDIRGALEPFADRLAAAGRWREQAVVPVERLHSNRDDSAQSIVCWRVEAVASA